MPVRKLKPIEKRDPYAALVMEAFDRIMSHNNEALALAQVSEEVCEVLSVADSFGPQGDDLNESFRNQITLRDEVYRLAALHEQSFKDAARYRFWRKHYSARFVLTLPGAGLKFDATRPQVEPAGADYERKVDEALDAAQSIHPPLIAGQ